MAKHSVVLCNICSKEMRSDTLKRHLNVHNNIKTYPRKNCSICNKDMRSWDLKRHMKTHSETIKNISENVETDQKMYNEKVEIGKMVKMVLEQEDINPASLCKTIEKL